MTDQKPNPESKNTHITYADDKAINPNHYQGRGGKQCYDVIKDLLGENRLNAFYKANVIKYLYRFDTKNGLQDIRKAKWYFTEWRKIHDKSTPAEGVILEDTPVAVLDTILAPFTDDKTACYALKALILKSMYSLERHTSFVATCIDKLEELWSSVEPNQTKPTQTKVNEHQTIQTTQNNPIDNALYCAVSMLGETTLSSRTCSSTWYSVGHQATGMAAVSTSKQDNSYGRTTNR